MSTQAQNKPQNQPEEVVGSGLSRGVIEQFKLRENLISDRNKSREHLLFFNGNGAWARLVSSVNTLTEKQADDLASGKSSIESTVGDNTLAYNNVLMGGTLKQGDPDKPTSLGGGVSEKLHRPIELDNNGYVKTSGAKDMKTNAYHKYGGLGFRPTPGLESVSVESKGTYGTLREAQINFKVWDLDDLEVAQALYLRPGYTVLVEWGHSLQLDQEGKVNSDIQLLRSFLYDKLSDPMVKFENKLNELRKDSSYNYDGFVGYVSNFDWSLNNDGGYDCSIKVISKGSVLESIAVTFDPIKTYPSDQITSYKLDKGKEERKSIFHKLFSEMKRWIDGDTNSTGTQAVQAGLGISNISPAAGIPLIAAGVGDSIADTFFGSDEELEALGDVALTTEAQFAQQNQGFLNRLNKLLDGDKFTFQGEEYSFSKLEQGRRGIADLEEEEVVYYLNLNFEKYGIKAVEGSLSITGAPIDQPGDNITLYVEGDKTNKQLIGLDNVFQADDYRESLRIYNFIKQNVVLPEDQLTEDQIKERERREKISQQQEIDRIKREEIAKETDADLPEGTYIQKIYTKANFVSNTSKHFRKTLNNFCAFRLKDLEKKGTGFFDNDDLNEFWIPLGVVLDVYNNYVSLVDVTNTSNKGTNTPGRKLTQFYTGWQDNTPYGKYEKEAKYLTSDLHFSINPMVCVLPKIPKLTTLNDSKQQPVRWPNGADAYQMGVVWKNGFHKNVESAFGSGLLRGDSDDILNILVSVQFLKDELDKIVKQDEDPDQNENNNIVTFMKTVLRGMSEAMGGINDLDLFYDESDDMYYIVDRKVTPVSKKYIPSLSLSGLKSTMSDVSISSQISKNIGNMVSIAAQGSSGNAKDNVASLLKWNAGLLDRHIRHKSTDNDDSKSKVTEETEARETPRDKRIKSWIDDYYEYWEEFNGEDVFDNGDFNADIVPSLANFHKEFCQKYVVENYYKNEKDPKPAPGVVPIELSFTTMGISGLKIGQAFQIEKGLLPARYSEDFGYIITGLSHNIQDSKWTTTVKTQFYITKKPSKAEIEEHKKTSSSKQSDYKDPTPSGRSGTPGPVVTSGAPAEYTGKTITSGFAFSNSAWSNVTVEKSQVMLHWTAGNQLADKGLNTIKTLNSRGVSYHYVIDAAGHVENIVPETSRAYHGGGTGANKISANTNSIGISLMNLGYCKDANRSSYGIIGEGQNKCVRIVDHNGNPTIYRGQKWNQEVTDAQLVALESLLRGIKQRNPRIPSYSWKGKETYDQFFPPSGRFSYEKNKPGYYSHCSSNKGKYDILPTPKILNFLKNLKL